MRKLLLVTTILMVAIGLLLSGTLIALQLSSPTGSVGDEGIIAIPLILILIPTTLTAFITGLAYLLTKRPKGKQIILPFIAIVFPLCMMALIPAYGNFKQTQGVISAEDAIELVKQCEVSSMQGANHKKYKLIFADNRSGDIYISGDDYQQVNIEIKKSEQICKLS